jgi:DNA-binding response OmpR family regulator
MRGMRLLVVEDDVLLAKVIQRGLVEEGHAVDLEASLEGAEFAVSINDYDLLILDRGLPDGDGLNLCRALRGRESPTRVLVLTARDAVADRIAGLDAGADDYLAKPFDLDELSARVRALLRRPSAGGGPILSSGDVRLDPAAHRVWRGEVAIPLTTREFSLLHYLLSRGGEVVSRSDILEHVWDAFYDGFSNVVDVHIASLRRKLDLPGSPAPIETVRGAGYRVSP